MQARRNFMLGNFSRMKFNWNLFLSKAAAPPAREQRRVGREHFIPVRPTELVDELLGRSKLNNLDALQFRSLCERLENVFHHETRERLALLQETYAKLNPDLDTETLSPARCSAIDIEVAAAQLFDQLTELLERANFRKLSREDVQYAIGTASALGVRLDLDLDRFEQLAVFARGDSAISVRRKEWRNYWYRNVEFDIPMYQRLVVVFRLRSADVADESVTAAYMRLFKNVPQQDIDMVLPGGQVRISLLDRGKILVPTISGVGFATFKLGLLLFAGIYGLLKIIGLLLSAAGSGWKSVSGYWKTKNKYELSLTRNLYYQNLDNNAGVLLRLSAEAERQEFRETALAYFVLLIKGKPCSTYEISRDAEEVLGDCGIEVDFEVADSIAKLQRLRLCTLSDCGAWVATPLAEATQHVMARNLSDALGTKFRVRS